LRKAVSALLHEVSDATSLPSHFNLEALTQNVSDRIAPQLAFLDHHDPGPDDFLDCVFNAVANEPFTTKQHSDDPTTYKQLLAHPNLEGFRKVMLDELLQLFDVFHAFTPVTLAEAQAAKAFNPDTRFIPTKWVWVSKFLASGDFNRLKARLVACEAVGRFLVDNKWSPTIAMDSPRLIFVIAAINQCEVLSLDVSGAYLRGKRRSTAAPVFLRLPPGLDALRHLSNDKRFRYHSDSDEPLLWRCDANLYGLQDAGAVWWAEARDWLLGLGFVQSSVDPCIFCKRRPSPHNDFCLLWLYVDDSLGAYSTTSIKEWYLQEFEKHFRQSPDSGSDHPEFIAIRFTVSPDKRTIRLNTPKLWGRLRQRISDIPLPSVNSPLPHNTMDLLYAAPSPTNPILPASEFDARGILGVAAWGVLAVRPAETFAASLLARRAHVPTSNYAKVLTYFVSYLLDHENDELVYSATGSNNDLTSFVDSSWGNCPETRRSWFGYAISWCGAFFSVRAKLQPCVALASRDAEAIAAVFAVKALLGFTIMLTELGFKASLPTTLHVDNKATVDSAHSEKLSKESRFMAMRLLWLR